MSRSISKKQPRGVNGYIAIRRWRPEVAEIGAMRSSIASRDAADKWDSLIVDDAHVIVRGGKYWLYYKGGHGTIPPDKTEWGVAIAERITGPYVKSKHNPLIGGHTVCLWPHREGIAALVDSAGPERHTVQWSPDGIHFTRAAKVQRIHTGCGPLDSDAFTDDGYGSGITWGVAQRRDKRSLHLIRFDCELLAPKRTKGE